MSDYEPDINPQFQSLGTILYEEWYKDRYILPLSFIFDIEDDNNL